MLTTLRNPDASHELAGSWLTASAILAETLSDEPPMAGTTEGCAAGEAPPYLASPPANPRGREGRGESTEGGGAHVART